jgi:hypothetical protein
MSEQSDDGWVSDDDDNTHSHPHNDDAVAEGGCVTTANGASPVKKAADANHCLYSSIRLAALERVVMEGTFQINGVRAVSARGPFIAGGPQRLVAHRAPVPESALVGSQSDRV